MHAATNVNDTDRAWLTQAFTRAVTDDTPTAPNPRVGCVIVDASGKRFVSGVSEAAGKAHAERLALHRANFDLAGATAYVTLEPCNHHGRTPPCTTALINAGVTRVVYATRDANPIAGGGAAALIQAGVQVDGPLVASDPLAIAIRDDLAGFFHTINTNRPHVTLKLAQHKNGNTIPAPGSYITGAGARRSVHRLRATVDAVLVGAGTVVTDNPALTVRDTGRPDTARQPAAVILDRRLTTPHDATVCRPTTRIITTDRHQQHQLAAYQARGVEILTIPSSGDDRSDVKAALATLARAGVNSVLAEPGVTVARVMCAAQVVDRLVLHVADGADAATFTPCVPLTGFRLVAAGRFDRFDTTFTFVADRKNL